MDVEKQILKMVSESKNKHEFITIADISRRLKMSRSTVSKYVYYLERTGKIKRIKIGTAKILEIAE